MFKIWLILISYEIHTSSKFTSMELEGYIDGDEMCWRQLWDVGDGFGRFCPQHPLYFIISVGHRQPKDVINIEILSLTSKDCHRDEFTNIYVVN